MPFTCHSCNGADYTSNTSCPALNCTTYYCEGCNGNHYNSSTPCLTLPCSQKDSEGSSGHSESEREEKASSSSLWPIIFGSVAGTLVLIIIVCIIRWRCSKPKDRRIRENSVDRGNEQLSDITAISAKVVSNKGQKAFLSHHLHEQKKNPYQTNPLPASEQPIYLLQNNGMMNK